MQEEHYWVQIDGGLEYTTNDSGRLHAMLFGLLLGLGETAGTAHGPVTAMVDSVVKEQKTHVEELKDGRVLRVSVVQPGEADE
jgi:hypothetical protein